MDSITIKQGGEILAHHTTNTCLSHYGEPVWVVETDHPQPGPATWQQGDNVQHLDILSTKAGWLIVRQPDGALVGILWSDGIYYADLLVSTTTGIPCKTLRRNGYMVRNTIQCDPDDPNDIGSILG